MLAMGFFFDQICNAARLEAGGSALQLNKFTFTSDEIYTKLCTLFSDPGYARNTERLKRIAHVASRRKHFAADLVEEFIYDTELRFEGGKELRPAHLQTADMRMPYWKSRNWDLAAIVSLGLSSFVGGTWFLGKMAWLHRGVLRPTLAKVGLFYS